MRPFFPIPVIAAVLILTSCSTSFTARENRVVSSTSPTPTFLTCATSAPTFSLTQPEDEGVNVQQLLNLTEWIQAHPQIPILSFMISRNGHVVYELLTSSLTGNEAHYLMSATKSVTSSLVGIALDQSLLRSPDETLSEALPPQLFASDQARSVFSGLTLKEVLGMSALNATVAPHENTPAAQARLGAWFNASNRVAFSLTQPLLAHPGTDFLYTDITPSLAAGAVQYASGQTLFDFANLNLFQPMGFSHQEWMHIDRSGIDNGAYGLRLRPIDMQKFGVLFLHGGCWNNQQLISKTWVDRSFTPWIGSGQNTYSPDYGWYWWYDNFGSGWIANGANGWRGQRIEVFRAQKVVVTMTAIITDGTENKVFANLVHSYIVHLLDPLPADADLAALKNRLSFVLAAIQSAPTRIQPGTEDRMIPTVAPKQTRIPFNPSL